MEHIIYLRARYYPVPRDSNAYWIAITLFPITRTPNVYIYRISDARVITNLSLSRMNEGIFWAERLSLSPSLLPLPFCGASSKQRGEISASSPYFALLIRSILPFSRRFPSVSAYASVRRDASVAIRLLDRWKMPRVLESRWRLSPRRDNYLQLLRVIRVVLKLYEMSRNRWYRREKDILDFRKSKLFSLRGLRRSREYRFRKCGNAQALFPPFNKLGRCLLGNLWSCIAHYNVRFNIHCQNVEE